MVISQRRTDRPPPPPVEARESCHALADAIAGHVDHILAVAGAPTTHLAELVRMLRPDRFEWAVNEKVAAETAVGLSAAGRRCCLVVKHNGLGLALDPLVNAAMHTLAAGMVVVSGDDPDALSSTVVQDSRTLGQAARTPVFEPALDGDTDLLLGTAVALSEQARIPVVVKVTTRMHAACPAAVPAPGRPSRPRAERPAPRLNLDLAHGLTKLGRHQRYRLVAAPVVQAAVDRPETTSVACAQPCGPAVIAVGATAQVVPVSPHYCRMVVRAGPPAPAAVVAFAERHTRTTVVEEPLPVLEEWLRAQVGRPHDVRGRLSGHLPPEGAVTARDVERVTAGERPGAWRTITRKPEAAAGPGQWAVLFTAVSRLRGEGAFVAADVGSSVRLCYPPYRGADVALCLGSPIAVAGGAARAGRAAVAVIGDYGLLHSGLESLLTVVERQLPVLVVVLGNGVQAKTGGQPLPAVDIPALVRACGVDAVERWSLADVDTATAHRRLVDLLARGRPAVAYVSGPDRDGCQP
jgi:indolepyruvate ferredoxin oxidoreductase alpha subunit